VLTQLLTDGNGLEVDKVRHLLVVSNATVLALIDTNTAGTHSNNQWRYWQSAISHCKQVAAISKATCTETET